MLKARSCVSTRVFQSVCFNRLRLEKVLKNVLFFEPTFGFVRTSTLRHYAEGLAAAAAAAAAAEEAAAATKPLWTPWTPDKGREGGAG